MKKFSIFLALFLVAAWPVSAADLYFPSEKKGSVSIAEETKNLYGAGSIISINALVSKDAYVVGNVVNLNADVSGNFNGVGDSVNLGGSISGSVHLAGGSVTINGPVADDLFVAGGEIFISESASIGGDLIAAGGIITVEGPVAGDIRLAGGEVYLNNLVSGSVYLRADNLELGSGARIEGDLRYTAGQRTDISEGVVLGEVSFNEIKKVDRQLLILGFLVKIISIIVAGLALIYLSKKFGRTVSDRKIEKVAVDLGLGLAVLVVVPVIAVILMVAVIGFPLAFLLLALYALLIILAIILANVIFGVWLMRFIKKDRKYPVDWQAVVLGTIVLQLLILIPFIGWLVCFLMFLVALGSVSACKYKAMA